MLLSQKMAKNRRLDNFLAVGRHLPWRVVSEQLQEAVNNGSSLSFLPIPISNWWIEFTRQPRRLIRGEDSFLGDRRKSLFWESIPRSNGCHDVNIRGYHGVNFMAATSLGLSYDCYNYGMTNVVSFVSLRLCIDFCSNMISLSIEPHS
jgi:hypothetical protein